MPTVITINDIDRTTCIYNKSIKISDEARNSPSTMKCKFINRDAVGNPSLDQEISITLDGTIIFAGYIVSLSPKIIGDGVVSFDLECIDYNRKLDAKLVVESYEGKTDQYIIEDILNRYTQGTGITMTSVEGTPITIQQISFNYMPPSECFSKLCDLTARSWFIDYEKDIHYFPVDTTSAPFNIDSDSANYWDLKIKKDNSQIRNRVYVRGGNYLSDEVTISMVADGEQTVFNLPDKPSDVTVKEDTVVKTLGIKNVDSSSDYDYLINFQEKYIEATVAPAEGVVVAITHKYYIPVIVAVENTTSIESVGTFEYAIFDNKIKLIQQARDRAAAELTDFADSIIDGKFSTKTDGFRAGQYINISLSDLDIDDDYYIQSVNARSLGGGNFIYDIQIGEANKIGIIKFLINLIEMDKNALDINDDEVVDELVGIPTETVTLDDSDTTLTFKEPPYLWDAADFLWSLGEWS